MVGWIFEKGQTLDYAGSVPRAWIVGVAFEQLPVIMLVLLMVAYAEARTL